MAAVLFGLGVLLRLPPGVQIIAGALLGGVVYVFVLFVMGEFRSSEKEACRRLLRRVVHRTGKHEAEMKLEGAILARPLT